MSTMTVPALEATADAPAAEADLRALRRARRQRVVHLPWMGASCGLDALVLAMFCSVGAAPWWTLGWFVGTSAVLIGVSYTLLLSGFSERFRDPYISAYQLSITALSMSGMAAIAPAAAFHFHNMLLVVFTFGALRLTMRQTLVAGAILIAAVGAVTVLHSGLEWKPPTKAEMAITWFSYVTVLSRCVLVGLYGSSLRAKLRHRNEQLAETTAHVQRLANHDELTGVLNRRAVWAQLQSRVAPPGESSPRLCVALLDIDLFKSINDGFGHPAGDQVLRRFCDVLRDALRDGDCLGRYGGEEFLLLLPHMKLADAAAVVDRLRCAVEAASWQDLTPGRVVTLSAGVATCQPGDRVEDVVARADAALYRAKQEGRNRVAMA